MINSISLLIVDDEESVRDSLYNWFIEDGFQVKCAEHAKEALTMLESGNYDIILADIKMPGMDGLEMHRRIKLLNPEAIVIIMTAFASVETAVQALKDGAYDYITKPFDPDDLSHLIRNAAKQIEMKVENQALKDRIVSLDNIEDIVGTSEAMISVLKEG
jgi:DNA-binding NtrC family response regulator